MVRTNIFVVCYKHTKQSIKYSRSAIYLQENREKFEVTDNKQLLSMLKNVMESEGERVKVMFCIAANKKCSVLLL